MLCCAGVQPDFCKYHLGHLRGAAEEVCGGGGAWWEALKFWEAGDGGASRLVVFKPGASKISEHWELPHR